MRRLLLTLIALGVLHAFVLGGEERPKLNVIVIFCDDLGYGELPVHRKLYQESEEFKTAIGSFQTTGAVAHLCARLSPLVRATCGVR